MNHRMLTLRVYTIIGVGASVSEAPLVIVDSTDALSRYNYIYIYYI